MGEERAALVVIAFEGKVIEWRGPAPFLFVPIPEEHVGEVRHGARAASYGWGCVPVAAEIDGVGFTTSLFPRGDSYLLPVKVAVQRQAKVGLGDMVRVGLRIFAGGGAAKKGKSQPGWMREF